MAALPTHVDIREVGPRDGFQSEPEVISTDDKVRLIEMLARTGLRRLEVTSFVRAPVIPQLADASEVLGRADIPDGVAVSVLVPNERGLEDALEVRDRIDAVSVFDTLPEAIADLNYVIATTARERDGFKPVRGPVEAGGILRARHKAGEKTGILFGRERFGL